MFGSAANKTIDLLSDSSVGSSPRKNKCRIWNPTKCFIQIRSPRTVFVPLRSFTELVAISWDYVWQRVKTVKILIWMFYGDSCDFNFCDGSNYSLLDRNSWLECLFKFISTFFLRRQKVIGHFIFFPKKFQERTPPESGSEEWWIFGQVHFHRSTISAQFAESSQASSHVTESTHLGIPGPIILRPVPAVSNRGYPDFTQVEVDRLRSSEDNPVRIFLV